MDTAQGKHGYLAAAACGVIDMALVAGGYFFCENQETKRLPREAFGNQMPSFIGFGTPEYETKLTVKTSPRWCPRRKKKE